MPKRRRPNQTNHHIQTQQQQPQESHFIPLQLQLQQALHPQIEAIRVVRDLEIHQLLTELRFLRSQFTNQQLHKPLLQLFQETLPNLSIEVTAGDKEEQEENNKNFHVRWKNKENVVPDSFLGARDLHVEEDVVLEEPYETQTLPMLEALQIPRPGVKRWRLSVGMASKTFRQPKPGEMLLSVRGSPLCVFKENHMEVIHGMKIVLLEIVSVSSLFEVLVSILSTGSSPFCLTTASIKFRKFRRGLNALLNFQVAHCVQEQVQQGCTSKYQYC
ncbi:hypothetical protein RIF29_42360 [Crotalaria pallida]|uniref:Uncharacterized protein n=1 Tax=Crotalaria pallida TaxID=3830 RepID=A0AAN9ECQ6_CROPI